MLQLAGVCIDLPRRVVVALLAGVCLDVAARRGRRLRGGPLAARLSGRGVACEGGRPHKASLAV
jgi:hypothetical protein